MNFPKLFHKSNSSIHQLQGNVLDCSIEQIRGNKVIVNTGMRASFACFRDELCEPSGMVARGSPNQLARARYKFFSKEYNDKQKDRLLLSGLKKHSSCNDEAAQQDSKEQPLLSRSLPLYWGVRRHSMSQGTTKEFPPTTSPVGPLGEFPSTTSPLGHPRQLVRGGFPPALAREKLTDELSAIAIHESFVPFLTAKHKQTRLFHNSSREGRNNPTRRKASGFWASLRTTVMLSHHSRACSPLGPTDWQGVDYPIKESLRPGYTLREELRRPLPAVGSALFGRPAGGPLAKVNFPHEPSAWAHEAHQGSLMKSGKRTRTIRILGRTPREGQGWSREDCQVPTTARTQSKPSISVSPDAVFRVDNGSLNPGGLSVQPTAFSKSEIVGLRDLKAGISNFGRSCVIGVEEKRSPLTGELICSAPKSMEKISRRKLVWTELTNLWRTSAQNRMKDRLRLGSSLRGFILNSVNGGYAVAIAGYIAFMPKSLCLNKKVFIGQWRQFAIIGMNPKIANIVVKEIRANLSVPVKNKVRVHRKLRRQISGSDRAAGGFHRSQSA
jgi:hypothetical protein